MGWFGCCGATEGWPSTVFINQDMEVVYKGNYMNYMEVNYIIEQMLDDCGADCISPPPMALFTYEIDELIVTFIDLSVSETSNIVDWHWDFGDGSTSQEQFPVHTYSTAGTSMLLWMSLINTVPMVFNTGNISPWKVNQTVVLTQGMLRVMESLISWILYRLLIIYWEPAHRPMPVQPI